MEKYTRALRTFYLWLPEEKVADRETVMTYKQVLSENQSPGGVNVELAALNGFFRFMGRNELCLKPLRIQRRVFADRSRELTREEYERLVAAADRRKDNRLSLLLQTMAATGIRVSEVSFITAEAVQVGKAEISLKGKIRTILLPGKLCRKLRKYISRTGITSGAVFRTRTGRALGRKEIWAQMKTLCAAAGVEPGKVFPHNLRHLFAGYSTRRRRTSPSWPTCWGIPVSRLPASIFSPPARSTSWRWTGCGWSVERKIKQDGRVIPFTT